MLVYRPMVRRVAVPEAFTAPVDRGANSFSFTSQVKRVKYFKSTIKQKTGLPYPKQPGYLRSWRPVAFRPRLTTGLALSVESQISMMIVSCQAFFIGNVIFLPRDFG